MALLRPGVIKQLQPNPTLYSILFDSQLNLWSPYCPVTFKPTQCFTGPLSLCTHIALHNAPLMSAPTPLLTIPPFVCMWVGVCGWEGVCLGGGQWVMDGGRGLNDQGIKK